MIGTKSDKPKKKTDFRRIGFLTAMLIIPTINFAIFYAYLNFDSIMLAFRNAKGEWTLENFRWVFNELGNADSILKQSFLNTFAFFINSYVVIRILSIFMSYFLYKKIAGYKIFRVLFYIPNIISDVVMTAIFEGFITPGGPFYQIIHQLTGRQIEFLADSRYAMKTMLVYCIWLGFGTGTIMLTSAMNRIPRECMESATLDGIRPLREIVSMILPLIWPTLSTLMITGLAGFFEASGPVLLFTQGKYGTYTIGYWIYEQVATYKSFWHASAMGLFCTVLGIPIVFGGRFLLERINKDVSY